MDTVFLKVFNLSIAAGWLAIAVIVLRLFLKRAPKTVMCFMWAIVAARLLLPFSAESALSLIPSFDTVPDSILYAASPSINSGIEIIDNTINPSLSQSLAPNPAASINPAQVLVFITSVIWLVGIAVMMIYMLISCIILRRKLRTATHLYDNIYESEYALTPFVFGLFRPRIYLPYNLNENDKTCVLLHENAHILRHDHILKPFAFILLAVYWFNPILWLSYIMFCRDIEFACDEKVIKTMNNTERKDYSSALLGCSINKMKVSACPLAFGEGGIKHRIKNVINYKKPALWIILISAAVCAVLALCFLTSPETDASKTDGMKVLQVDTGHDDVKFSLKEASYDGINAALKAKWKNSSKRSIEFGENYEIFKISEQGLEKCQMNDNMAWNDILISLLPGGHGEYTYNITDYYILSSPGKYRFEINYNFDDDKNTKYSVTVDFEIYYISFSDKDIQKTYVYKESSDIMPPTLTLYENNRFSFFYSSLSSYYPIGSYTKENGKLICKTDDNNYTYAFTIDNDRLIFIESESAEIPKWNYSSGDKNSPQSCVPDGAVFY
ncbi:MAG: hypothetical protein J6K66_06185 [Clostridia bacterium]|nr:hypothetical protein [Clostridia bacterium]